MDESRPVQAVADQALGHLFNDHYVRLVQHLSLIAGSRDVAADAVQEAFVQAHVRWAKVGNYDDPPAWIRRVALNRIHNHHRAQSRGARAVARLRAAPDDEATPVVDRADVQRALTTLSPRQRTAVVLHHLEGLTVREVALLMGVSDGSVKTHLLRARDTLRPLLEGSDAR